MNAQAKSQEFPVERKRSNKKRPELFPLRVIHGGLRPADRFVAARLNAKGYHVGDLVFAQLKKPRNPGFHRLAHRFATLVANNIDDFAGMNPHAVLKRLQWESGVGCEEMGAKVPGVGFVVVRIPESLSFENMDDGEFRELFRGLARHVSENYWNELAAEQIEEMAASMPEEV